MNSPTRRLTLRNESPCYDLPSNCLSTNGPCARAPGSLLEVKSLICAITTKGCGFGSVIGRWSREALRSQLIDIECRMAMVVPRVKRPA